MSDNPYAPPQTNVVKGFELSPETQHKMDSLANGQKYVVYAALLYFITAFITAYSPKLSMFLIMICLVMSILGLLKVIHILPLHNAFKCLYFILLFVPFLNMLVLLSLNSQATKILKAHGYTVGLLGAHKKIH